MTAADTRRTEPERATTAGFSSVRIRQLVGTVRGRIRTAGDRVEDSGAAPALRRGLRRIGDWVAPITTIGWSVLVIAAVTLGVGLALSWRELVIIGAAAALLMLAASAFVFGQTRYRVRLDLEYTRVVAGERALGQIEIEAVAAKALVPASIEIPVGDAVAVFDLPRMAPGDVHEDIFVIPTERRGVLTVGPVRSVRGDALGLVRRLVTWTEPVDLFVHPKTVLLTDASIGMVRDLEGVTTRELTDSDISFHALRDYAPGDDRRHIHWKSTARTGALMVRQFEQTRRSRITLAVSTDAADYGNPEEFETAVSLIGSLGLQAIRDDLDLSVRTSRKRLPVRGGRGILDELSAVEYERRTDGVRQLAEQVSRHHPDSTLAVMVVGSGAEPPAVRRARRLISAHVKVIVLHIRPGEPSGVVSDGDMTIVTLSSLAQLPMMVRRMQEEG